MPKFSNQLTDAELERLAILSEELGEAQQAVGKILRHGYESRNPLESCGLTNRAALERELGDVLMAIQMLAGTQDVSWSFVVNRQGRKRVAIKKWLHHNL